jgi:hypothetical protein
MEIVNLCILGWPHGNYFEGATRDDGVCIFEDLLGNVKRSKKVVTFFKEGFDSVFVHSFDVILRQTHATKYPFLFLRGLNLRSFQ